VVRFTDSGEIPGAELRSSDGQLIGQVSAVHVPEGESEPLFVQVETVTAESDLIVPVNEAAVEEGTLVVPYSAATIERGPTVDPAATLSIGEVAYVLRYYDAGEVEVGGHPLTERSSTVGDVAARDPHVRSLPPIVVARPGFAGDRSSIIGDADLTHGGPHDPA
jgi:hypothetical protein